MLGGNTQHVDPNQFKSTKGLIAITNVNVWYPEELSMTPNQTILIENNSISYVGDNPSIPNNYHIVDGHDKYLIPGLIDSHVHIKKSHNDLLLYLANGITQVGEMTGLAHHFELARQIEQGTLGPNIYIASPKMNSHSGIAATSRSMMEQRHQNFTTPSEAKAAVRKYKEMRFDAIKLSSDLNRDIYYAINEEAKKLKIPVIGHLPVGLQLTDLYASGQSQLAHIDSITHNLANEFGGLYGETSDAFIAHIQEHADAIAQQFKAHNIALASTVWLHQTRPQQDAELESFFKSIPLAYQNPGWLEGSFVSKGCLPGHNTYQHRQFNNNNSPDNAKKYYLAYNEAINIITRALIKHGVTITAGTDSLGACGMIAGFALHQELVALQRVGLSNIQVLNSATKAAAQWMKIKTGQIRVGYRADLVLLNKNPLENIAYTQEIAGVVANGHFINRRELNRMLAAVKNANAQSRTINIDHLL